MRKYLWPILALVLVLLSAPRLYSIQPWGPFAVWGLVGLAVVQAIRWFVLAPVVPQLSGDTLQQVRRRGLWATALLLIATPVVATLATGAAWNPMLFLPSVAGLAVLLLSVRLRVTH